MHSRALPRTRSLPGLPRTAATALALLLLTAPRGSAQVGADYRISQRAAVEQTLSSTTVRVEYSRPTARGRSPLFGALVHWGEVWTPGANEATVLEVDEEVELDGHAVPAGRWSVWMIPSDVGPWELLLDPRDTLFHTQRPEIGADGQIRFPVATETVEHVDALTWSFPRVARDGATLVMAWGTTAVPLEIGVETETPVVTIPADESAMYVGAWEVTFERAPGGATREGMPPVPLEIRLADDGALVADYPPFPPPGGDGPTAGSADGSDVASAQARERDEARRAVSQQQTDPDFELLLVPRAEGVFLLGFRDGGVLLDVEHVFHEFEFEGGRAVRFSVRGGGDEVMARGERVR